MRMARANENLYVFPNVVTRAQSRGENGKIPGGAF